MFDIFTIEVALILGLAVVSYYYGKEKYSFFKKRNIPNEDPVFLFGNSLKILTMKENFISLVSYIYRMFPKARIAGMYQGFRAIYVVRDPEIVNRILIQDFSHFHDRGIAIDEITNPLEGNLFNLEGNKWKTLRNKMIPVFTSGKLKSMYPLMDECVESFIKHFEKDVGKDLDIKDALARLTTDVIGSCAFGIDSEAITKPDCEFRKMGQQVFNPPFLILLKQLTRFMFPTLTKKLNFVTIPKDVSTFFYNITRQNFALRAKEGIKRNDFMELLLELRDKGNVSIDSIDQRDEEEDAYLHQGAHHIQGGEQLEFTEDLLTAQAFVFFIAGFETTATSMSFALYFLSKYQDVQDKLRLEIQNAKEKYGSLSYQALKSMKYLDACINESLRIYPPVGALFRKCNKTLRIDDELMIEEGYSVFIPVEGLHNDPQYFPEPESFKPDRFLTGSVTPGTFMPFGDGPRICIAQRFALVELKLALSKIVDRYRIDFSEKMPKTESLELVKKSFIPQPVSGLFVKLNKI